MDRIAALRRIEQTLAAFESGETDLDSCEQLVRATVRTFATEFDGDLSSYRAENGTMVVAASEREARERVSKLTDVDMPTVHLLE